jgi:hypothetical protein
MLFGCVFSSNLEGIFFSKLIKTLFFFKKKKKTIFGSLDDDDILLVKVVITSELELIMLAKI